MGSLRRAPLLALVLLSATALLQEDTVYLKNGNKMEGIVKSESATEVVLDIGYGTVTLLKADIRRIKRPTAGGGVSEADARQFELGRHIPDDEGVLDSDLRQLMKLRQRAKAADDVKKSEEATVESAQQKVEQMKDNYNDQLKTLQNASAAEQSEIIAEMNRISAKAASTILDANSSVQDHQKEQAATFEYLTAYDRLHDELLTRDMVERIRAAEGWDKKYFAWVRGQLSDMSKDFKKAAVPVQVSGAQGNQVVANVLINGRVYARMIVDTGASVLLLSKKIADQLDPSGRPKVGDAQMGVADGRTVRAEVVRLTSVSVGDSEVKNVTAAVVDANLPGCDGLLGMTFLNRFVFQVDAPNGRLILRSLR